MRAGEAVSSSAITSARAASLGVSVIFSRHGLSLNTVPSFETAVMVQHETRRLIAGEGRAAEAA
jgi:hypothetical protein